MSSAVDENYESDGKSKWSVVKNVKVALKAIAIMHDFHKNLSVVDTNDKIEDLISVYSSDVSELCSLELVKCLTDKIEKGEIVRGNFLDIGAGNGFLTSKLEGFFEQTTVIEPNPNFSKLHESRLLYREGIQNFDISNHHQRYDLILFTHVLFYIPRNEWDAVLQKVYSLLNKGGIAVVALIRDSGGLYDVPSQFGELTHTIAPVRQHFEERSIKYEEIHTEFTNFCENEEIFTKLLMFAVATSGLWTKEEYDALDSTSKEDIKRKCAEIACSYKTKGGAFELDAHISNVLVQK